MYAFTEPTCMFGNFLKIVYFKHIFVENHGKVIFLQIMGSLKPMALKSILFFPDPGVRQALWLTKTKLIPSLPPQLLSLAENPANQIQDLDERVKNAIKHARFWDTTEDRPNKEKYRYCIAVLCSLYLLVLLINLQDHLLKNTERNYSPVKTQKKIPYHMPVVHDASFSFVCWKNVLCLYIIPNIH